MDTTMGHGASICNKAARVYSYKTQAFGGGERHMVRGGDIIGL